MNQTTLRNRSQWDALFAANSPDTLLRDARTSTPTSTALQMFPLTAVLSTEFKPDQLHKVFDCVIRKISALAGMRQQSNRPYYLCDHSVESQACVDIETECSLTFQIDRLMQVKDRLLTAIYDRPVLLTLDDLERCLECSEPTDKTLAALAALAETMAHDEY